MRLKQLIRLLTLLALLVAPVGMLGRHAAMAAPRAQAAQGAQGSQAGGHCAEMAGHHDPAPPADGTPVKDVDCTVACSTMPSVLVQPPAAPLRSSAPLSPLFLSASGGLNPQAEPPPPRPA